MTTLLVHSIDVQKGRNVAREAKSTAYDCIYSQALLECSVLTSSHSVSCSEVDA